VAINGVRVFLTGFLVYFVDPALGKGFMHITEGWLLFLVSLSCMGLVAWLGTAAERRLIRQPVPAQEYASEKFADSEDFVEEGVDRG
jgi:hypothetical protein